MISERIPRDSIHGAIWRAAQEGPHRTVAVWDKPISAATLETLRRGGWTVSVRGDAVFVFLQT